jgi:glycerophosphoryl diester phosphodiesterase
MSHPLIIAHRALAPGTAENAISSLPALEAAGVDLVELDIRLSLDRQPFVTHDAFLNRTTHARGWLRLWPSPLLRRVPLREGAAGEHLASLSDMLGAFPPGLQPALHLKDRGALGGVLRTIARRGNPSRTWLWLEEPADVQRARTRLPELRCTLLRPSGWRPENRHAYMSDARRCGANAVSLPWGMITPELIALAHEHRLLAFSRFQETPAVAVNVRAGLDGIITDDPALIAGQLDTMT